MKLGWMARVVSVASVALVLSAPLAATAVDLRATLEARYDDLRVAIVDRDEAAIKAVLAPDFISVEVNGEIKTANQMVASLVGQPRDPNKHYSTTILSVLVTGDKATVDQRYDMTTRRPDADGTMHDQRVTAQSTDTWVRADGVWLCQRTMTNEIWIYRDGKLATHLYRPVT